MKSRIRKSIMAMLLCLTLVGTSSISALHADASEVNGDIQSGQSVGAGGNAGTGDESSDVADAVKDSELDGEGENDGEPTEEPAAEEPSDEEEQEEEKPVSIEYQTHVQSYGWQKTVKDGALAGTSGKAKRLEAIKIKLTDLPEKYEGSGVEYAGQAKRLEAITVKLTGSIADDYDVYYRTHVQTYGWLGWAKNGEKAGSATASKRMEAIEIKLVKKGEDAPESTGNAYKCPLVGYQTHMQSYGWRSKGYDNAVNGVTGKSKRMEALKISLPDVEGTTGYTGGIAYQVYVQGPERANVLKHSA